MGWVDMLVLCELRHPLSMRLEMREKMLGFWYRMAY